MRLLLILIALSICLHSPAQEAFTKNRWSTTTVIGLKDFTFSPKAVGIILDTLNRTYPYGYITEFLPDSQFISYNTGPCGNECRILSKGTYTLTQNTITLFVKSLSYAKDCQDRPSEEINTSLGMYRWEQKNSRLILTPLMP